MDKSLKEKQKYLIILIDDAIEKVRKRKEEIKNDRRPQLIEMLDLGIENLEAWREGLKDVNTLQDYLKPYKGTRPGMGLSRGFGEFDCGDEVKDAVRAVEHYFRSM